MTRTEILTKAFGAQFSKKEKIDEFKKFPLLFSSSLFYTLLLSPTTSSAFRGKSRKNE